MSDGPHLVSRHQHLDNVEPEHDSRLAQVFEIVKGRPGEASLFSPIHRRSRPVPVFRGSCLDLYEHQADSFPTDEIDLSSSRPVVGGEATEASLLQIFARCGFSGSSPPKMGRQGSRGLDAYRPEPSKQR